MKAVESKGEGTTAWLGTAGGAHSSIALGPPSGALPVSAQLNVYDQHVANIEKKTTISTYHQSSVPNGMYEYGHKTLNTDLNY